MEIQKFLKGKVTIIGMGNPLKGDDNAGNIIVKKLMEIVKSDKVNFLVVEEGIENFIGKIEKLKSNNIIIVDAVNFKGKIGEIRIFYPDQLMKNSTTTHSFSLPDLLSIYNFKKCLIIGIQPGNLSFGTEISKEVKESIDKIVLLLAKYLTSQTERRIYGKNKNQNRRN